jgi:hypothetical protein
MTVPVTLSPAIHEGFDYPSPISRILVLGYYDGPTNGVLQCGEAGAVYKFDFVYDLVDGLSSPEDRLLELRVYSLAPLPAKALTELASAYSRFWPPRWPVWVPIWHFGNKDDEEAMNRLTDQVLRQAGPVNWVVASFDLTGTIRAAKSVTPQDLARITDWLAFLGIDGTSTIQKVSEDQTRE